MSGAQGVGQGLFVDQAAAGGIDDKGRGFHQAEFAGTDQVQGVAVQRAMQGQSIDLRQQLIQRQTICPWRPAWQLAEQHAHAEGFGQPGHRAAQLAVAEQAEGLAMQLDDRVVEQAELRRLLPAAGAYIRLVVGQAGGQGEQQHQGVLSHRWGAIALAITHHHAVGTGGSQVEGVGAGGCDQYQPEVGAGGKHLGVEGHLVADSHLSALQAFDGLGLAALWVQLQFGKALLQGRKIEVAQVEGAVVEKYRAGTVAHQLYLSCRSGLGVRWRA